MSKTVVISFTIKDGEITEASEHWSADDGWVTEGPGLLTDRRDIEDAVARVANAPVGGREKAAEPPHPEV